MLTSLLASCRAGLVTIFLNIACGWVPTGGAGRSLLMERGERHTGLDDVSVFFFGMECVNLYVERAEWRIFGTKLLLE